MAALLFMRFWPDVPIDRDKSEQEIFSKYFSLISHDMVNSFIHLQSQKSKSLNLAIKFNEQGNFSFKKQNYHEALKLYNATITQAPCDSIEYALAMGNRSTALFMMKKFKECLTVIEIVLKSNYPLKMLYKIYLRQAKCFINLKCYEKADQSLEAAQNQFNSVKANLNETEIDSFAKKFNEIEKQLHENCFFNEDVKLIYQEELQLPALKDGENENFTYASKAVSVKQNRSRGRHVIANRDIKEGEVLFLEEPYCFSTTFVLQKVYQPCSNCLRSSSTWIPCSACTDIFFCTASCKEIYWKFVHRWECLGVRKSIFTYEMSLTLRILSKASRSGFNTIISDYNVYGNKDDNYPFVNRLSTHKFDIPMKEFQTTVKSAVLLVVYLLHYTDYFDWLMKQQNRPKGSRREIIHFVGGVLLKYLLQVNINARKVLGVKAIIFKHNEISLPSIDLGYTVNAYAIYVSTSMLNHSCVPNVIESFHNSVRVIRAVRNIKARSEIVISYITQEKLMKSTCARQAILKKEYMFHCTCIACCHKEFRFPWLCPKCKGRGVQCENDIVHAECMDCQYKFCLDSFIKSQSKLKSLLHRDLTNDKRALLLIINLMKKIYHTSNLYNYTILFKLAKKFESKGDYSSTLEYINIIVELFRHSVDAGSSLHAAILFRRCATVMALCLKLREENSPKYGKTVAEARVAIQEAFSILKWHCSKQKVDRFYNFLKTLFENGNFPYRLQCRV